MRSTATLTVVTPGPFHQGDTVTFSASASGVITLTGFQDGVLVWANGLFRGDLDVVLSPSLVWTSGPLHVIAELRELVGNRVKTIASTSFEVLG